MKEMKTLPDVQNQSGEFIHDVSAGVTNLVRPVKLLSKSNNEPLSTIAEITLMVHLPKERKGVNMSRLPIAINGIDWNNYMSDNIGEILNRTIKATDSKSASVAMEFPFFYEKESPATNRKGMIHARCEIEATRYKDSLTELYPIRLGVSVPVMTCCPCSKEISTEGAHNQRAIVTIHVTYKSDNLVWIEDVVEIAEKSGSSAVYPIVKRPDEKAITEHAYNNPKFVEDVVRDCANLLEPMDSVVNYHVQVTSQESIHQHDAIAVVEGGI